MDLQEWKSTDDITAMLERIRGHISDRKLLLFACGCCRIIEPSVPTVGLLAARLEQDAERPLTLDEKWSMFSVIGSAMLGNFHPLAMRFLSGLENDPWHLAKNVAILTRMLTPRPTNEAPQSGEFVQTAMEMRSASQAAVLREIVTLEPRVDQFPQSWRTETVLGLAAAIDLEQAWDRMPILADALEDAGCDELTVLNHCRDLGVPHRRGCWVLDWVLGRS